LSGLLFLRAQRPPQPQNAAGEVVTPPHPPAVFCPPPLPPPNPGAGLSARTSPCCGCPGGCPQLRGGARPSCPPLPTTALRRKRPWDRRSRGGLRVWAAPQCPAPAAAARTPPGPTPPRRDPPQLRTLRSASAGRLPAKRKLDLEGPELCTPKGKGRTLAQVPSPRTPRSPGEKTRYDTSLGLLTKKFTLLLSESPDGVLDLNRAAELLEVQKRRIYDITNVLEGIQLIRKKSKNHIQWMGTGIFEDAAVAARQQVLRGELAELGRAERALDQVLQECSLQLRRLTDDGANQRLAYVTYQDLRAISSFQEQTVIAVKAPPETRLEVPDLSEDNLQLHLKSTNGPIEVYLCPEEIPEDSPTKDHDVPQHSAGGDNSTHPSLQNSPEPPISLQPPDGHRAPPLSPSSPLSSPAEPLPTWTRCPSSPSRPPWSRTSTSGGWRVGRGSATSLRHMTWVSC
uniref:E2F transcription factor 2 n=1 Tax=Gallus gallus TaxID=9031 RepID=A0A8V0YWE9_CHICK